MKGCKVAESASTLGLISSILANALIPNAWADDSASATVYGKASVSMVTLDDDGDEKWELTSNASRLGFKGSSHLSDTLDAIYKLEFEVYFDDGDSGGNVFKQRNIYVGLQGKAGTLFVAKHDSSLKMAQLKVDRLNDLPVGDIKNILIGENRLNNIVSYTSPRFNGFSTTIQLILNEGDDIFGDGSKADSLGDSISTALNWQNDRFKLALAYDQDVVSSGKVAGESKVPFNTLRLTGQALLGAFDLGAIVERSEDSWNEVGHEQQTTNGYIVSCAVKSGNWKFYIQLGQSDMPIKYEATDNNRQIAVGVDYKLAKPTKLFAYYSSIRWEDDATVADQEDRIFALGIEHKF